MYKHYQRLEPLGASDDSPHEVVYTPPKCKKCICLEDEKDTLQSSLFSLTTHFAQVQFRLRQVVSAKFEDQEDLVKSLEEFAFSDVKLSEIPGDHVMDVHQRHRQQKCLLDKLKLQVNQLDEFNVKESMNWDQLLKHLHIKEDLERQLKTQIEDLERFSQHLKHVSSKCDCKQNKKFGEQILKILDRSFSFLQMFVLLQFHSFNCFKFNTHRKSHWGDLRAKLELAIIDVKSLLHYNDDSKKITKTVRKSLATCIKDLMEHGTKLSFFHFLSQTIHGWDIILYYYHVKKGDDFNSSSFCTLSRSFNVAVADVSPKTNKRNLLYVIEEIITSHSRYKRSSDSQFRAFVCAALNAKRLVAWLNLIFHCGSVIDTFYYPWSYVANTKYQDGLRSLDVLTSYKFNLPVDFDVRKFRFNESLFA